MVVQHDEPIAGRLNPRASHAVFHPFRFRVRLFECRSGKTPVSDVSRVLPAQRLSQRAGGDVPAARFESAITNPGGKIRVKCATF